MNNFSKNTAKKSLFLLVSTFYFFFSRFMLNINTIYEDASWRVYIPYALITLIFIIYGQKVKIEFKTKLALLILSILLGLLLGFMLL